MSEQQSQKHGLKSSGQKETRAREGYESQPASNKVAGAFGKEDSEAPPATSADLDSRAANENPGQEK